MGFKQYQQNLNQIIEWKPKLHICDGSVIFLQPLQKNDAQIRMGYMLQLSDVLNIKYYWS